MTWSGIKNALDVTGTLVVITVGAMLGWRMLVGPSKPSPVKAVSNVSIAAEKIRTVLGNGKVAIVEFADFECPYCARYANTVFPTIKQRFVDAGIARYVPFQYPLEIHPRATKAAEAAECARRQGKYWELHEVLFVRPAALEVADLRRHAATIGLDETQFSSCLSDAAVKDVQSDRSEGQRLNVTGTPSFFLGTVRENGSIDLTTRIEGAVTVELLGNEIEKLQRRVKG